MQNILKLWIFILSLLMIQCAHNDSRVGPTLDSDKLTPNNQCEISGPYPAWENLYCRMKTGITDRTSKALRPCEAEANRDTFEMDNCEKVRSIKERVCKIQTDLGYIKMGLINCIKSKELEKAWLKEYISQ